MDLASKCMEEDNIVAMVAVLPKKTRSIVGFLSMNGFNTETPSNAAFSEMLARMKNKVPSVDVDLSGDHATELRALHMLAWKHSNGKQSGDPGGGPTLVGGQAAEDAAAATKAVKLYKRLHATQGVLVSPEEQLSYSFMNKCSTLYEKNGTINLQLCLSDMKRQ